MTIIRTSFDLIVVYSMTIPNQSGIAVFPCLLYCGNDWSCYGGLILKGMLCVLMTPHSTYCLCIGNVFLPKPRPPRLLPRPPGCFQSLATSLVTGHYENNIKKIYI